jgi:succinate dehydrogenase / fumarate reductase membrane anchor subunit
MTQSSPARYVSAPRAGENMWLWMIKMVTGPILVILLLIHFVVNHFVAETGLLTYADVVAYYRNPLIPIMEILFLATVVAHSLIGLRGILLDLNPARRLLKVMDWGLILAGISAISYGVWLVFVIVSRGV